MDEKWKILEHKISIKNPQRGLMAFAACVGRLVVENLEI